MTDASMKGKSKLCILLGNEFLRFCPSAPATGLSAKTQHGIEAQLKRFFAAS